MATIIVLFNLQEGVEAEAYEQWATSTDLPVVRNLASVDNYDVFRSSGLFGSDDPAPYGYIELIEVNDSDLFAQDIGSDIMTRVAGEFQSFADNPQFLVTDKLRAS